MEQIALLNENNVVLFEVVLEHEPRATPRPIWIEKLRRAVTPKGNDYGKYIKALHKAFDVAMGYQGAVAAPLRVDWEASWEYPGVMPKKMRAGKVMRVARPDVDNLEKAVLDTLTGVVVAEDSFVVQVAGRKVYTERNYLWVRVTRLAGPYWPRKS